MKKTNVSRREFLVMGAAGPLALRGAITGGVRWGTEGREADRKIGVPEAGLPMGIEMYSVREGLKKDAAGTVRAVAGMGYAGVEFYAPYFEWTESETKQMRKLLDDLGIRCFSTHNDRGYFSAENVRRTADLNLILGSKYAVMSSAGEPVGEDGWKAVAEALNFAAEKFEPAGLKTGYHNHQLEFTKVGEWRPIEILAKNTKASVALQLDVGTCIEAGASPVEWIRANPGRIRSIHCKDWSPESGKGYTVLFGEGVADWKKIFEAAESVGGTEYYLMEQEGSRFSELETAKRCLEAYRGIK